LGEPDVRYILVDLGPIPNEQLSAFPPLRAGLLALKYSHQDGDAEAVLVQAFTDARDAPSLFKMLVVYATTVYASVNPVLLRRAIHKVRPEWEDEMLSIAAKEWMAEGAAKGRAEGKAEMLLRQLRRRFHTVPSELETRVRKADDAQLDEWSDRFVDAKTLRALRCFTWVAGVLACRRSGRLSPSGCGLIGSPVPLLWQPG